MHCDLHVFEIDLGVGSRTARNLPAQGQGRMTMELRKKYPPTMDVRELEHAGFSQEQIAGLLSLKARGQRRFYHEDNAEQKRLAFVRWLYEQGRLES